MKLIAHIISVLFHPLFIPTVGVYLLFSTPTESISFIKTDSFYFFEDDFKIRMYSLMAVLTIAAPFLSMVVLKTGRVISSYKLENAEERTIPLIMMIIYLGIVTIQMYLMDPGNIIPWLVKTYVISIAFATFIILILNRYTKVSWHTAGIASLIALMYVYLKLQMNYNVWIVPALCIILGIVATSRLILEQHKESELYLGAIIGFGSTFLLTTFL